MWQALLLEYRLPWRYKEKLRRLLHCLPWIRQSMTPLDYFLTRPLFKLTPLPKCNKEDITVVIAAKNRYDHRIINALESIRSQNYDQSLIKIIIVDYDSNRELATKYKDVCKEYNAEYVRVDNKPIWNKAHALNIGIRRVKTKYLLSSDLDNIFEKNYLKEAIKELQRNPYQVISCNSLDLPDIPIGELNNFKENFDKLKSLARVRCEVNIPGVSSPLKINPGTNLTLTHFYHKLRGYDEQYLLCYHEDADLLKRFLLLKIVINDISDKTSFVHQWHPLYGGEKNVQIYKKQIKKNWEYFKKSKSIARNKKDWGQIDQIPS